MTVRNLWSETTILGDTVEIRKSGDISPTADFNLSQRKANMQPKELIHLWVERFNAGDADGLAALYAENATNHQIPVEPVFGREAIRAMFRCEFSAAAMTCIVENVFQDGEWAILEWRDPKGLRGCGFFHVLNDKIVFQRGYWDKQSFLKSQGLPFDQ